MKQAFYRVGQFLRGLDATIAPEEVAATMQRLPPGGVTLFLQMPVDAQRHSLNVLHWLEREHRAEDELAAAALLHDCGKMAAGGKISLWTRGPLVLLESFLPGLVARLAQPLPSRGWRYVLWVQEHHAAIGAAWAQQVGCSAVTCWLIAHHQDKLPAHQPEEEGIVQLLRRLQEADKLH